LIFDRLRRGEEAQAQRAAGPRVGLLIARAVAAIYRLDRPLSSFGKEGTVFAARFPLEKT
jgi:signal transduction histidine kinase